MSDLKVETPHRLQGAAQSQEIQPSGTPDPAAVEWLRAVMNGTLLPHVNGAAGGTTGNALQGAQDAAGSMRSLAQRILNSLHGAASDISNSWHEGEALRNDLQQRSFTDPGYMQALIDLQKNNATTYLYLDMLSKTMGKAVYTIDSLGRT